MKTFYKLFLNMLSTDKKIKALVSSMITGNKAKADSIIKELIESTLEEKEKGIVENYFSTTFRKAMLV